MCRKVFSSPRAIRLNSSTGTAAFHPTTAWMPISGYSSWAFNVNIEAQAPSGTMDVRPGYQLAAVRPDNPDSNVTAAGSYFSSEGYHLVNTSPVSVADKMFWRLGVIYKAADSTFGACDVSMDVAINHTGRMVGRRTIQMQPMNPTNEVAIFPVSDWFVNADAVNAKAGIVIADSLNDKMQTQLYVRGANDKGAPNTSWTALEGGWSAESTGDSERNTGTVSLSALSGSFYGQLGLAIRQTAGVESRASIHVLSAVTGS